MMNNMAELAESYMQISNVGTDGCPNEAGPEVYPRLRWQMSGGAQDIQRIMSAIGQK